MGTAQNKYDKANTKSFSLKLNINTDKDIIAFLQTKKNVQGYLKNLIRNDKNLIDNR